MLQFLQLGGSVSSTEMNSACFWLSFDAARSTALELAVVAETYDGHLSCVF